MANDKTEQQRRGLGAKRESAKKEGFFMLDWEVMDNPAFRDLSASSIRLLLILMRQLNGKNNGQLQATFKYAKHYGFNSEHTLQSAIAQLISHGFIYRTRSHGANKAWARYALTWLPIQDRSGLFLAGFMSRAWRFWEPPEKKAPRKKCRHIPAESAVSPTNIQQKVQGIDLQKVHTMNNLPSIVLKAASGMMYRSIKPTHRACYKPRFAQRQSQPLRC